VRRSLSIKLSILGTGLSPRLSVGRSVGRSVRKVYCGKTVEWIRVSFGVVSGVDRGMGVLDGVVIVEEEEAVLGVKLRRSIVIGPLRRGSSQITFRTCFVISVQRTSN